MARELLGLQPIISTWAKMLEEENDSVHFFRRRRINDSVLSHRASVLPTCGCWIRLSQSYSAWRSLVAASWGGLDDAGGCGPSARWPWASWTPQPRQASGSCRCCRSRRCEIHDGEAWGRRRVTGHEERYKRRRIVVARWSRNSRPIKKVGKVGSNGTSMLKKDLQWGDEMSYDLGQNEQKSNIKPTKLKVFSLEIA